MLCYLMAKGRNSRTNTSNANKSKTTGSPALMMHAPGSAAFPTTQGSLRGSSELRLRTRDTLKVEVFDREGSSSTSARVNSGAGCPRGSGFRKSKIPSVSVVDGARLPLTCAVIKSEWSDAFQAAAP
mmetsp:Transcript_146109/g.253018  ORF Transcript_146109/g.253018 Transcript_146109/m.253018 type:complete len:127 (+) Transcript_146109:3-383(+)